MKSKRRKSTIALTLVHSAALGMGLFLDCPRLEVIEDTEPTTGSSKNASRDRYCLTTSHAALGSTSFPEIQEDQHPS
ncbi:hypothetical protein L218DRAFT_500347 [Marasmius fiardii PR-910]|nr:hypothetical protein L218DRAFT_500347 [Marasmius fiardii PR-910]